MLLNVLPKKTNLSNNQIKLISQLKEETPKLFSAAELNKVSKIGAYISFCLCEYYDYVNAQFNDGVSLFTVKMAINDEKVLKGQLSLLKQYL